MHVGAHTDDLSWHLMKSWLCTGSGKTVILRWHCVSLVGKSRMICLVLEIVRINGIELKKIKEQFINKDPLFPFLFFLADIFLKVTISERNTDTVY